MNKDCNMQHSNAEILRGIRNCVLKSMHGHTLQYGMLA